MAEAQIMFAQTQNKLRKLRQKITPVDRYESKDFNIKKSKPKRNVSNQKPKKIFRGHKASFRRKDELKDEIHSLSSKIIVLERKVEWYDRNSQVIPPWKGGHRLKPSIKRTNCSIETGMQNKKPKMTVTFIDSKKLQCLECDNTFTNEKELNYHMINLHMPVDLYTHEENHDHQTSSKLNKSKNCDILDFECPECGYLFDCKLKLANHKKQFTANLKKMSVSTVVQLFLLEEIYVIMSK